MSSIGIIGGGAAGMFAAVCMKERRSQLDIVVLESGDRPLRKVAIAGGGRCNVTNTFAGLRSLEEVYPRGARLMRRLLGNFGSDDMRRWLAAHGVPTVVEGEAHPRCAESERQCVFPRSEDAMSVVRCLADAARRTGVRLEVGWRVAAVEPLEGGGFRVSCVDGRCLDFDRVVVATGGATGSGTLSFLPDVDGLQLVEPVPSLFALALDDDALRSLQGTVAGHVAVRLAGTKLRATGALLVTHWGVSGPAVLRLSSYAARWLHGRDYRGTLVVDWTDGEAQADVTWRLADCALSAGARLVATSPMVDVPRRLWEHIVHRAGIDASRRWAELGRRQVDRLSTAMTADEYNIVGRWKHKSEFVTAGGIALSSIAAATLEVRACPGLYAIGEATDVDGVTGGFNLQAAWSMGWTVAKAIAAAVDAGGR